MRDETEQRPQHNPVNADTLDAANTPSQNPITSEIAMTKVETGVETSLEEPFLSPASSSSNNFWMHLLQFTHRIHLPLLLLRDHGCLGKKAALAIAITLSVFCTELMDDELIYHHQSSSPTPTNSSNRIDKILQCASHLSPSQYEAVEWLTFGPGQAFEPIPQSLQECTWNTDFGSMYALLILKSALGANYTTWNDLITPMNNIAAVCHHWHRVGCSYKDGNNQITSFHLANSNFTGTIPNEIFYLSSLIHIEFHDNPLLQGTLPQIVLPNLEFLNVRDTGLAGTIPQTLGQSSYLKTMFLEHTNFRGTMPREVCGLKRLEELYADCTGINPKVQCDCCTHCYPSQSMDEQLLSNGF